MTTVLNLEPITTLTRSQFRQLCVANPDLFLERSPHGELLIMSPVGGESGRQEANLIMKVGVWNEQTQLGVVFSSQTMSRLQHEPVNSKFAEWWRSRSRCGLGAERSMASLESRRAARISAPLP